MNLYCNNCGNKGHIYRNCKFPVLSYGIICINNEKLLMIQRKDSICYIEFLRGKYKLENTSYINSLLNRCSVKERHLLSIHTFDELWDKLWFSGKEKKTQTERMIKEYTNSKHKFEQLQQTNLSQLIEQCKNNYDTPEWEFPKGRRSTRESNLQCAIREFEEETDLQSNDYILLENVTPISEEYTGSNNVRYKHIYYIAIYQGVKDLTININKYEQYSEIGDIQWLSVEECYSKIRKDNNTKNDIISSINKFINHWKDDFILKE